MIHLCAATRHQINEVNLLDGNNGSSNSSKVSSALLPHPALMYPAPSIILSLNPLSDFPHSSIWLGADYIRAWSPYRHFTVSPSRMSRQSTAPPPRACTAAPRSSQRRRLTDSSSPCSETDFCDSSVCCNAASDK